jgi:predicted O-linked N-acetylglucosamine transferase (SPINDLY family)
MDSQSERKLRELRLNLAEVCLEGRMERLAALCRNPAGDAIMTMVNSGVRHLALTKAEQAVAERCHRVLSVEHDMNRKVGAYLGLSLFSFPQSIERAFELIEVPTPVLTTVVKLLLAVPMFFTRDGMRKRSLAHLEATVRDIHKAAKVIEETDFQEALLEGFVEGFTLTSVYGEDVPLKTLAVQRAELIRAYLRLKNLDRDVIMATRPEDDPIIRLGVLCPGAGSETAALRGHLMALDRSVFNIVAFVPDEAASSISANFADVADDFIALPVADIAASADVIVGHNLDILLAGANLTNACKFPWTLLMAQRLAHLQVAMHSCPLSTGFTSVDAFINGELNEPPDAEQDYTEQLLLLPGSSNHYIFPGQEPSLPTLSREQLGVPDAALLLASGANFFKIGPDLVDAWARILEKNESAHLLLYPFNPNWTTHYPFKGGFLRFIQAQFAERGVGIDRLHVIEAQASRGPLLSILQLADLYLDSFPYSGAVSIIDPLSMGCPPVVKEGKTARCRQSAAMLREVGLDVLVTKSVDDYVTLVTRLLQDDSLRREITEAVKDVASQNIISTPVNPALGEMLARALADKLNATQA